MDNVFNEYRKILQKIIDDNVCYVVCYIKKNSELMQTINEYCKELPIANSKNLNEKAYWFLH